MRAHKLKIWPKQFRAVRDGRKTCELRRADRDYRVGDLLMLCEFDPMTEAFSGEYVVRRITHGLTDEDVPRGLVSGFVLLSIEDVSSIDYESVVGGKVELVKP